MKEQIKIWIEQALQKQGIEIEKEQILVEVPKEKDNGNYASNIALQLAKTLHKNPQEIANNIQKEITNEEIEKVEVAKPGFLNFYLKPNYLLENIKTILAQKENYGKSEIGKGTKVNIEYVSANPTGILHLGHTRGACYGDSLARILEFAGYEVTREYYINDGGNQIENLVLSIKGRYEGICGRKEEIPENGYHGKEIIEIAKELYEEYGENITDTEIFRKKGLTYLLDKIKKDLSNIGVTFDIWTSEKNLYEQKEVENTLHKLQNSGYTYEQDGALWLKTTTFGDEKDRVLVKSDHTNTYLLPDIAYHINKYRRGYDQLIDVLGADHHGYVPRLKASIQIMGEDPKKLSIDILQMVRLIRNNEEVKMSKRTGNAVGMNDVVEEVGRNATRYLFISKSLDTQMDFNLDIATKQDTSNPVYYVEYAYARICSILREYKKSIDTNQIYDTIKSGYALALLSKLYELKEIVQTAAKKRMPHILTNYVYEVASAFHSFYAHEKVLTEDSVYTKERIALIQATAIVIKNTLNLIGVEPMEKM